MSGNPQTYASLQTMLLAALVRGQPPWTVPPDAFFAELYPQAITYAEGRIYKDLVLLATRKTDTSLATAANSRSVALTMSPQIIVPEGFALINPSGTRVPFDVTTLDVIDEIWPTEATVLPPAVNDFSPRFWALLDASTIVYCPTADAIYSAAITGLFQPVALSASNTTTYLSTVLPELLEAACMVFLCGALQHQFSPTSDNPAMAISWESQYVTLMQLAKAEEMRRRGLTPDIGTPRAAGPTPA